MSFIPPRTTARQRRREHNALVLHVAVVNAELSARSEGTTLAAKLNADRTTTPESGKR